MSLTKKRKQLIAASLAAMTAFGATVPAIVASAPAAFAAETAAASGLSGAGITADSSAADTYNVSETRIVPNSTDFEAGKSPNTAETDFSERTVSFNFDGLKPEGDYVLVQQNPAMYNWYTTNWNTISETDRVQEGTNESSAKKTVKVKGSDLQNPDTILVQKGKTATYTIYEFNTDLTTSTSGKALATYTLNAPADFKSTAFAKAPTVRETDAKDTTNDWKNQNKITVDPVVDNGDGTYSVNVNVNQELESYESSEKSQGTAAWVGLLIGNFFKESDTSEAAQDVQTLYYFADGDTKKAGTLLTGEDPTGAGGTVHKELALYLKGDEVATNGSMTRKIAVSTAQNPTATDQVAVLNITLTRKYTPSEPATETVVKVPETSTGNVTLAAGTEPNTYTLTGTVFGGELDSSGDMFGEPNGTDKNKENYAEVIVSIPMPTDFTEGDLELYSKSLPAYYSKENLQGATDNTDADLTNYGAYHRVTTATKDSGIFTTEGMSLLLHKEEDGTVGNFKIVVGGQTYTFDCSGVTFTGTSQVGDDEPIVVEEQDGSVTIEETKVKVTVAEGVTQAPVEIPDTNLLTYLNGSNSVAVPVPGQTEDKVVNAAAALTINVELPVGLTPTSITLPQSVIDAAANKELVINITQDGKTLYTWTKAAANPNEASAQLRYAAPGAEARVGETVDLNVQYGPATTSESYEGFVVTFSANAPTTGWTVTIPGASTSGTYRAYTDAGAVTPATGVTVTRSGSNLTIEGGSGTIYVLKQVSSGNTGGGSTIPGGGGGGTTDPGEESNVQLDTQIVYMINEVSLYDFLVEGNNDTDNITVTSSNEAVATVALQDGADTRGAKYRVTTHGTGEATITVTYNGESATMDVVVYPKGGSITLDTVNYRMAPGNIYDIGVTVTDGAGTALSGEQVQQMYQNGTLRVTDSRTGSIVDLTQLPNGNFRVTGKNAGTCWITYEVIQDGVAVTHASVKVDVAAGVTQGGVATRDTSWWADKSADTTTQA